MSPCGSCGALDELGGDASTPIHDNSSGGRRRPGSGGRSSGAKGFRETAKVVKRKLENGTIIINKYEIVEEIGRGSYGSVHLCRDGDTGLVSAFRSVYINSGMYGWMGGMWAGCLGIFTIRNYT